MKKQNKLICSKGAFKQYNVLDTEHQYLTPDYFLPASQSESYYSKKYSGDHATSGSIGIGPIYKLKSSKISRVSSVMLLSLSFLATAMEVKAQPAIEPNQSFLFGKGGAGISGNIPIPPKMPQSSPSAPPIAPSMPDFVSETSSGGKSGNRSALFESIRSFGKGVLKLKVSL